MSAIKYATDYNGVQRILTATGKPCTETSHSTRVALYLSLDITTAGSKFVETSRDQHWGHWSHSDETGSDVWNNPTPETRFNRNKHIRVPHRRRRSSLSNGGSDVNEDSCACAAEEYALNLVPSHLYQKFHFYLTSTLTHKLATGKRRLLGWEIQAQAWVESGHRL